MPPKLKFDDVYKFFIENGCTLLSTNFINVKDPLEYICKCGHTRISTLDQINGVIHSNAKHVLYLIIIPILNVTLNTFIQKHIDID